MCIINWSLTLDFTSHLLLLALEDGITLDYLVTQKPYRLQLFPVFVFAINQDVHSWQWEFGKLPSHTSHQYPQNRGGLTGDQPTVTAHQGLSSMAGAMSTRKFSKQICTCHSCQKIQDAKPYTQLWCSGWWHIEPFYKNFYGYCVETKLHSSSLPWYPSSCWIKDFPFPNGMLFHILLFPVVISVKWMCSKYQEM